MTHHSDACLWGSFSSRTRKITLNHFLSGPNWTKFENREKVVIPGNSMKNCHFRPSKCHKLVIFQDIYLKFCTHVHLTGFFHIYFGLWIFENYLWFFFENNIFIDDFKIFEIFKVFNIWDGSLIAPFILSLLMNTISFYPLSCFHDVSRKPFCLKPGKQVITLTSFMVDVSELMSFPFVRMCQIDGLEGTEN